MKLRTFLIDVVLAVVGTASASSASLHDVRHIIVIYLENRSFDNLYGLFPGADGLGAAGSTATQVDKRGKVYSTLPPVMDTTQRPAVTDPRFPADLANRPFEIDQYSPIDQITGDPVHRFWHEQMQIDGGKMDKFAAYSDAGALAMGYYEGRKMKLWEWAKRYTLADHFFHAAFGGSLLNHFFLICACVPQYDNAPDNLVAKFDGDGKLMIPGPDKVTPDGHVVNNMEPSSRPHSASITDPARLMPPQDMTTIGDELTEKGIDWAWYAGGWNKALQADRLFQFHPQPFVYFRKYAEGTEERSKHLKDEADFEQAITAGNLPPVVFYKPIAELNEHPGYTEIMAGDAHIDGLLRKIEESPIWADAVIIVTYDENGGYWDHVPPPKVDRWGPGTRVPTLIISPFAKRGFIDHAVYDTTSILKLIEKRFALDPMGSRDRDAGDLTHALDLEPMEP